MTDNRSYKIYLLRQEIARVEGDLTVGNYFDLIPRIAAMRAELAELEMETPGLFSKAAAR